MATYSLEEVMGGGSAKKKSYTFEELTAQPQQPGIPTEGTFADPIGQGLTLGLSDELAGAVGAPIAWLTGNVPRTTEGLTGAYAGIRDKARQQQKGFAARNPKTATGLELAGGLMTGGAGAAKTLGQQTWKVLPYLKTAGASAAGGGVYGFGTGEGATESAEKAKQGAITGAVTGPLAKLGIDKGVKAVASKLARKTLNKATQTIEEVTDSARALYQQADDIGMAFRPDKLKSLTTEMFEDVSKKGFDKDLQPGISRVLSRFAEEVDSGQPITLAKLDTLRQVVNGAYGDNKKQNMMVQMLTDKIDRFAENLSQKDLVAGSPQAAKVIGEARKLWSVKSKHDMLSEALRKAESQASGIENGIRTQFRQILNNTKKYNKFTKAEQSMIKNVVDGNFTANTLRGLGRFAPVDGVTSHWLSAMMGSGGGFVAGGPAGAIAVPLAGQGAQFLSRQATQARAADALNQVLRGGGRSVQQVAAPMVRRAQTVTDPLAAALGMQLPGLLGE